MALKNGIISGNVSAIDVRNCLDAPFTSVGALCGGNASVAKKINMWAKYKPVRYNFAGEQNRPSEWWKAQSRNCGINVPGSSSRFEDMLTKKYTYEPPRGGSSEPFRLRDFKDYYHFAKPQYTVEFPEKIYNREICHIRIRETGVNNLSLLLGDLFSYMVDDLYFICRMIASDHTYAPIYATTQAAFNKTGLGNQTISFYFNSQFTNWFKTGTTDIIVGLCNFKMSWDDATGEFPLGALFWPLPFRDESEIHRVVENTDASTKLSYDVVVPGGWNGGGIKYTSIAFTQIKGSFSVVNQNSATRPFNTSNQYLRYSLVMRYLDTGEEKKDTNLVFYSISPNVNDSLAPGATKSYTFHIYTGNSGITRPFTFEFTILQLYDGIWRTVGRQEGTYNE